MCCKIFEFSLLTIFRCYSVIYSLQRLRFYLLNSAETCSEAHAAFFTMGAVGAFLGVESHAFGVYHSPPSSVEVKTGRAILQIPHTSSRRDA
jgi:hypothetical protein